jgi:hypothetical protein
MLRNKILKKKTKKSRKTSLGMTEKFSDNSRLQKASRIAVKENSLNYKQKNIEKEESNMEIKENNKQELRKMSTIKNDLKFFNVHQLKKDQIRINQMFRKCKFHQKKRMENMREDQTDQEAEEEGEEDSQEEVNEDSLVKEPFERISAKFVVSEIVSNENSKEKPQFCLGSKSMYKNNLKQKDLFLKINKSKKKTSRIFKKRKQQKMELARQQKILINVQNELSSKFLELEKNYEFKIKRVLLEKDFQNEEHVFKESKYKEAEKDYFISTIDNLEYFSEKKEGNVLFFKKENIKLIIFKALAEFNNLENENKLNELQQQFFTDSKKSELKKHHFYGISCFI